MASNSISPETSASDPAVDTFAAHLAQNVEALIEAGTQAKREEIARNLARIHHQAVKEGVRKGLVEQAKQRLVRLPDLPEDGDADAYREAIQRRTSQIKALAELLSESARGDTCDDDSLYFGAQTVGDLADQVDALVTAMPTAEVSHG